jgi:hypothetical protein
VRSRLRTSVARSIDLIDISTGLAAPHAPRPARPTARCEPTGDV